MNETTAAGHVNETNAVARERIRNIAGWVLSALVALPFIPSAAFKLTKNPQAIEGLARQAPTCSGRKPRLFSWATLARTVVSWSSEMPVWLVAVKFSLPSTPG